MEQKSNSFNGPKIMEGDIQTNVKRHRMPTVTGTQAKDPKWSQTTEKLFEMTLKHALSVSGVAWPRCAALIFVSKYKEDM